MHMEAKNVLLVTRQNCFFRSKVDALFSLGHKFSEPENWDDRAVVVLDHPGRVRKGDELFLLDPNSSDLPDCLKKNSYILCS